MVSMHNLSSARRFSVLNVSLAIIGLFILFGFGLYGVNVYRAFQNNPVENARTTIDKNTLQEKYGIVVNLVAVTAGGGMVDVRFKFTEGAKAKLLLQNANNFPTLFVQNKNIILQVPETGKPQNIQFDDDGGMFLLYPNAGSAVKAGENVTLVFGDIQLEPIQAK